MGMKEIKKVLDNIETPEVKVGAEEAVILMCQTEEEHVRRAAKQTYVALARFGSHLKDSQEIKPRVMDEDDTLKNVITESGIAYFGPMFKHGGYVTPLHDRDRIFKEMAARGYSTEPLAHLTDIQLDMLFTKILESGLLSDFNAMQPQV